MGSKNKLKRFEENKKFPNVIQPKRQDLLNNDFKIKGNWNTLFFKNKAPIILELGCGKGEYCIYLAKKYPQHNFIGIDIKGARFWRGAKICIQEKIKNVGFVRAQIELIDCIFENQEINEIWLTFPDPQIKFKRSKHRLTHPYFLEKYEKILIPKGILHLKTDSQFLYGYTQGILQERQKNTIKYAHNDIYNNPYAPKEATEIQTFYEKKFLEQNKPIAYMRFEL